MTQKRPLTPAETAALVTAGAQPAAPQPHPHERMEMQQKDPLPLQDPVTLTDFPQVFYQKGTGAHKKVYNEEQAAALDSDWQAGPWPPEAPPEPKRTR